MAQGSTGAERSPRLPRLLDFTRFGCAMHLWAVHAISVSTHLGALAIGGVLVSERMSRVPWRKYRYALLPLGVYCALVIVSTTQSMDTSVSWDRTSKLASYPSVVITLILLRGELWVRKVADGLIIVGSLVALYALGQALIIGDLSRGLGDPALRLRATFSVHTTLAGILTLILCVTLAQLAAGRRAWRWWKWTAALLMVAALGLGLTRGAWLALAATLFALATLCGWKWLAAFPALALGIFLIAPGTVVERLTSDFDLQLPTYGDRLEMWRAGGQMIRDHPVWGVGTGMVRHLYPEYRTSGAVRENPEHLHSAYIQAAADNGLPTLAAILWFLSWSGWCAFRGFRRARVEGRSDIDLYLASVLGILAFAVGGLFEDNWNDSEVQRLLFFLIAIPGCLAAGEDRSTPPSTHRTAPR